MPLTLNDSILSTRSANANLVVSRLPDHTSAHLEFANALVKWCAVAGVDPVVALIQWLLETGNGTSDRFRIDKNSCGLGITGSGVTQPIEIPDWDASARLHVQALYSLVKRTPHPGITLWSSAQQWMTRVWYPKVESPVAPQVRTVVDLGIRYVQNGQPRATWSWEDGSVPQDTYGKKLVARGREFYPEAPSQESGTTKPPVSGGSLIFGRVPKPAMVELIVSKPEHNDSKYGYIRTSPRRNVGVVHHETQGRGSGQFYHDFFSCPNGERCANALVDFFIDRAGTIFMLNDPNGTRAGWANGGGVGEPGGLEGDGPAFYSVFGVNGINLKLVSIEYEKTDAENMTQAQIKAGGALAAWVHDQDSQPWEQHPFVPKYGCVTSFLHYEFGTTNCGKNEQDEISAIQAVSKGIMKQWQVGGGTGTPIPPDVPPQPDPEIPGGITLDEAKKRFGRLRKHMIDGTVKIAEFDPKGAISLAWANRCANEGTWPESRDWYVVSEGEGEEVPIQFVTFSNSWMLWMQGESDRNVMQWVDIVPLIDA